jgi:hypothetical protein
MEAGMRDILSLTMLEKEYLDRPQTQNYRCRFYFGRIPKRRSYFGTIPKRYRDIAATALCHRSSQSRGSFLRMRFLVEARFCLVF